MSKRTPKTRPSTALETDPQFLNLFAELPEDIRDIIATRAKNTGESLPEAARAAIAFLSKTREELAAAPDGWAAAWLAEPAREPSPGERDRVRSQPPWMQALMVRFPPNCLVQTKAEPTT